MKGFKQLAMAGGVTALFALGYGALSCEGQLEMTCTADKDCFQDVGYVCDTASGDCKKSCETGGDCLDSEICESGMCLFGSGSGGSGGGGGSAVNYCVQCADADDCVTTSTDCPTAASCKCTSGYCIKECVGGCSTTEHCLAGTCEDNCDAAACSGGSKTECNTTTGTCVCKDATECSIAGGGDLGSECYATGCGCKNDGECGSGTTAGLGDTCDTATGRCSCSDNSECTATGLLQECRAL